MYSAEEDHKPVKKPTGKPIAPSKKPIAPTGKPIAPTGMPIVPSFKPISPTVKPIYPVVKSVYPTVKPISSCPSKLICQYGGYCKTDSDCWPGNYCNVDQLPYYSQCLPNPSSYKQDDKCLPNYYGNNTPCSDSRKCCDPGAYCNWNSFRQCQQPVIGSDVCSNPTTFSKCTVAPSNIPTIRPTDIPSKVPSKKPTNKPTTMPSKTPTDAPTDVPTGAPTKL